MNRPDENLPDDYAYARGLVTGIFISVCIWIAIIAAVLQSLGIIDLSVWQGLMTSF